MGNKKTKGTFSWKGSVVVINKKSLFFLIIVILFFVGLGIRNGNREKSLLENGIEIKAFIYSVKEVGGKGTIRCFYHFYVGGKLYDGFVDNENYLKGDSISILYNKSDPSYNRDYNHIKKYH